MRILGFGDCCVDYYIHKQMAYPGGNGLNVAVFAGENGAQAAFLGTVGTDEIGSHILRCAAQKGIDTSHCPIKSGSSGKAAVNIIEGNRVFDANYFNGEHGVGSCFPPMLSKSDLDYMKTFDLIHGSCYAHIEDQMVRLKDLGVLLSFDFSEEERFRSSAYLEQLCPCLDFALFSCEHMDDASILSFARQVMGYGCKNILATMGGRGQRLFTEDGSVYEGTAKRITPVDTMGAGDSFCAAFLTDLLKSGWRKGGGITGAMAGHALETAAAYSAGNCLVEGSFGCGLEICM